MIPAQEWYTYQEQYEKYGLDFDRGLRREVPKPKKQKKAKITARDRKRVLLATLVIGVFLLGVVVLSAYAAVLKFNISDINNENEALRGEVETLTIMIQSEGNIGKIETKAADRMAMQTPSAKNCVHLKN